MQFIDLSAQQKRIRNKVEARIKHVLDHGQYIMGPEVRELEEKMRQIRVHGQKVKHQPPPKSVSFF